MWLGLSLQDNRPVSKSPLGGVLFDLRPVFHATCSANNLVFRRDLVGVRLGWRFFFGSDHKLGAATLKAVSPNWFSVKIQPLHLLISNRDLLCFDESSNGFT